MRMSRRTFVKTGLSSMAYCTTLAATPNWIVRAAHGIEQDARFKDRILVILQQDGGNDGLNTVIPYTDPEYRIARPALGVPLGQEIGIDDLNGFHPRLAGLADWYLDKGQVGIVHNVGYPNPNLSHFASMDLYEYGTIPGLTPPTTGWVSRMVDHCGIAGPEINPLDLVASGIRKVPVSFRGISSGYIPPAIEDAADYALQTLSDRNLRLAAIHSLNSTATTDPDIDFLQRSVNLTEASIQDLQTADALPTLVDENDYPEDNLGKGLKLVSKIIRAGFGTKVYYVSQGGYDTHGVQVNLADPLNVGEHPALLDTFDRSVSAFLSEMEMSGDLDRVLILTFSEFGRRLRENGGGTRRGTDHGAANCLFVLGGRVQGGVFGGQPDLTDLIKGNLRHKIDFRSVFTKVIEDWFGCGAIPVFGQEAYDGVISTDLPRLGFLKPEPGLTSADPSIWRRYGAAQAI